MKKLAKVALAAVTLEAVSGGVWAYLKSVRPWQTRWGATDDEVTRPLPGDDIVGYLSSGKGIVVHREECPNVIELRKSPERCVPIEWDRDVQGDFRAQLRIEVINRPGVLATVAAAIAAADSNIDNVEYVERDAAAATLLFSMEVKSRKHLAEVIRRVRRTGVISGAHRYPL